MVVRGAAQSLVLRLEARGHELFGRYENAGVTPLALTFWWNRSMRVVDDKGVVVPPGPGAVLPCGAMEDWQLVLPGETHERPEPLACTQPAGATEKIGWSYDHVPAGRYRVTLIYQAPPPHGFTQSGPHKAAFIGLVESNTVELDIAPPPPKKKGVLARLFG